MPRRPKQGAYEQPTPTPTPDRPKTVWVETEKGQQRELPADAPVRPLYPEGPVKTLHPISEARVGSYIEYWTFGEEWAEALVLAQPTRVIVELTGTMEFTIFDSEPMPEQLAQLAEIEAKKLYGLSNRRIGAITTKSLAKLEGDK